MCLARSRKIGGLCDEVVGQLVVVSFREKSEDAACKLKAWLLGKGRLTRNYR
jgi:hypothetical protein